MAVISPGLGRARFSPRGRGRAELAQKCLEFEISQFSAIRHRRDVPGRLTRGLGYRNRARSFALAFHSRARIYPPGASGCPRPAEFRPMPVRPCDAKGSRNRRKLRSWAPDARPHWPQAAARGTLPAMSYAAPTDRHITLKEAARRLGISPSRLRHRIADGTFPAPAFRWGGKSWYREGDVMLAKVAGEHGPQTAHDHVEDII